MFLGRPWRKKRQLLLSLVPAPPKAPAMSFSTPSINGGLRDQQWFEACLRSHNAYCGCNNPVIHFNNIAARFNYLPTSNLPLDPPGQTPPRRPALRRLPALPAAPPTTPSTSAWPTGDGGNAGGPGAAGGGGGDAADADYRSEDLDDLFAAIEGDTQ